MSFQDRAKRIASSVGAKVGQAAGTAKLRADLALVDREIGSRRRRFGIELYERLGPTVSTQEFYSEEGGGGMGDQRLAGLVRPSLIAAHREVAALDNKIVSLKGQISAAEVARVSAFGAAAESFGDKVAKAGRTASKAGSEGKLKTELALLERKARAIKEDFGMEMYGKMMELEEAENWLPKDRDVRSIYDRCRQDIEAIELKREQKKLELADRKG